MADILAQTLEKKTTSEALLADIAGTKISFNTEETAKYFTLIHHYKLLQWQKSYPVMDQKMKK